jgi:hypothetical protein
VEALAALRPVTDAAPVLPLPQVADLARYASGAERMREVT